MEAGDAQLAERRLQAVVIDRIVLEHVQGVEQALEPGIALQLRQVEVLVFEQAGLLRLQAQQQVDEALLGLQAQPRRHGVDEQADHLADLAQFRRARRHGGAEHHVVAAEHAPEQQAPGALDQCVQGQAVAARELGEGARQRFGQVQRVMRLLARGRGPRRQQQGRFFDPVQRLAPGLFGLLRIALAQPGQVIAIGRGPAQFGAGVQGEQFLHQHRQRPAVEQDVVVGDEQAVALLAQRDQGEAQQGRGAQVEAAQPFAPGDASGFVFARCGVARGRFDAFPGQRHPPRDHLHRTGHAAMDEARAQVRMALHQRVRRGAQPRRIERAFEVEMHLHHVGVGPAAVVQGVEQQALLQRRQRQDVGDRGGAAVAGLDGFDGGLVQRDQRQVRGAQTAGLRVVEQADQRAQSALVGVGEIGDLLAFEQGARPRPGGDELRALGAVLGQRVELDRVRDRHRVGAGVGDFLAGLFPVAGFRHAEAAKIIEADLRRRLRGQDRRGVRVEVAQQPIAQALRRDRTQLLLDLLEQAFELGAAGERLVGRNVLQRQAQRIQAGEPAERARQIEGAVVGFAAVAFQVQQHVLGGAAGVAAAPVGQGQRECAEQHVVDAGVEARGQGGQQRRGDLRRQAQAEVLAGGAGIALGVQRERRQRRVEAVAGGAPMRQFGQASRRPRLFQQVPGPGAQRLAARGEARRLAGADGLDRFAQVGNQDAPGHAVDGEVVDAQQQPAGLVAGVEPDRAQQLAALGRQRRGGVGRAGVDTLLQCVAIEAGDIDPPQQRRARCFVGGGHPQPPLALVVAAKAQAQGVVMLKQRVHGGLELRRFQRGRHPQQHRLVEPVQVDLAIEEPAQDRPGRQLADRFVEQGRRGRIGLARDQRQRGHALVLEHVARRNQQPGLARQTDQLDRNDAVAAEVEEAVGDADPRQAQHLRVLVGEKVFAFVARGAVLARGEIRRRQGLAVDLAVRGQRQRRQQHQHRLHVVGQLRGDMAADVAELVEAGRVVAAGRGLAVRGRQV